MTSCRLQQWHIRFSDNEGQPEHHQCENHRRATGASWHRGGRAATVVCKLDPCATYVDGHVPLHGPQLVQQQLPLQHWLGAEAGTADHLSPPAMPTACQGLLPPGPGQCPCIPACPVWPPGPSGSALGPPAPMSASAPVLPAPQCYSPRPPATCIVGIPTLPPHVHRQPPQCSEGGQLHGGHRQGHAVASPWLLVPWQRAHKTKN